MPLWKNADEAPSAPKFTTNAANGKTGIQEYGTTLEYVRGDEGYGVAPGWARKTVRGSRTYWESIVAIRDIVPVEPEE